MIQFWIFGLMTHFRFKTEVILILFFLKFSLALMAVRNCVVRSTELRPKFLELHAEILANEALEKFNLDEAKACLRDLGCEVKLKEIWTGSGKKLERGDGQRLKDLNIT